MKHLSEQTILELADGLLTPAEQSAAEAHITSCSACREQYDLFKSLEILLSAENVRKAPPAITDRVMQQVELHNRIMARKAQSRKTLIKFTVIMSVFILALGVLAFMSGAVITFQTPAWVTTIREFFDNLQIPKINPLYVFIILPVVFLLFAELVVNRISRHRFA
ncbi:MAG TPA: zf-HC2 domain-containing protein [Bacteroidales bacterium]|jgi:anti-sigma factor RsiW|nr:zf-HC2 domain-containing protein [Bacteroidales bacterium]HNZ43982.1 zf-HC2 domain-containing protein [Bacteroidales bacterium]HOH84119.1 zf-HC2 domain-containing protein [Bacteroidales bacterium]HPB24204.1 zf-HC2 domain-containing protein [Bacteroidales bacterium]HPI30040.1 zf-HC2 domain-containing protein [Bacteroidales bacterium]